MPMKNRQKIRLLAAGWLLVLLPATFLLLRHPEPGNPRYLGLWAGLAPAWVLFALVFTPLGRFAHIRLLPDRMDGMVLFSVILLFFLIALSMFIGSLFRHHFGTALLFALIMTGTFNIMRDMAGKGKKGR